MMVTKPLSMSRVAILAIVAVALSPAQPSRAAEPSPHLYQSAAIVTGQELPNRSTAARIALPRVLVKISGDPSVALDRRLKPYANRAIDLVTGFTYRDQMAGIPVRDEQGTRDRPYDLTLRFDPARIDDILKTLGRKPWSAARPRVAVFFSLDQGAPYMVSRDDIRSLGPREALHSASERAGLDVVLPSAEQIGASLDGAKPLRESPAKREALAAIIAPATDGDHVVLTGEAVWDDNALGWRTDWQLDANGKTTRWRIERVSYDDAFRNGLIGTAQILSGHGQPPKLASGTRPE